MSSAKWWIAGTAAISVSGCSWLLGESFVAQDMRHPETGATVVCTGHIGRGEASAAEIDTMNACVSWYQSKGYAKVN